MFVQEYRGWGRIWGIFPVTMTYMVRKLAFLFTLPFCISVGALEERKTRSKTYRAKKIFESCLIYLHLCTEGQPVVKSVFLKFEFSIFFSSTGLNYHIYHIKWIWLVPKVCFCCENCVFWPRVLFLCACISQKIYLIDITVSGSRDNKNRFWLIFWHIQELL